MNSSDKTAVVDNILTRAAENLGDITPLVMAIYYQRFPEAEEHFKFHSANSWNNLEGEMVERSLYCLMHWVESPGEVEILLLGSVPHHSDTLHIPPQYYQGLLTATADVIGQTIPPENSEERKVWDALCIDLAKVIAMGATFCITTHS